MQLAYGPADATATHSCFSKIQIGFTFLVPAYLGSPGKGPLNGVCVCGGRGELGKLGRLVAGQFRAFGDVKTGAAASRHAGRGARWTLVGSVHIRVTQRLATLRR